MTDPTMPRLPADADTDTGLDTPGAPDQPLEAEMSTPTEVALPDEDRTLVVPVEADSAAVVEPPALAIVPSCPAGTYDAPLQVTLACSAPAPVIHFTVDGAEPSMASARFAAQPISVDRSMIVAAQAYLDGRPYGETVRVLYTLRVGAVTFSVDAGTHHPPLTVALSCPSEGASIYYTLDGGVPTPAAARYAASDPLLLRNTTTVTAVACMDGWEPSDIRAAVYELRAPQWLDLEPAEPREDPVPHAVSELCARPDGWRVIAASVRGRLHAHRALWRDDAYRYAMEGPWTIIAVSDGAGSAPLSRVGARVACDRATQHLVDLLAHYAMQEPADAQQPVQSDLVKLRDNLANAALQARIAVGDEARTRNRPLQHFAATLLLVVHCRWKSSDFAAAIQIGDGSIALWHGEDGASLLGVPDHGEHSSETRFLTTNHIEREFLGRVLFTMKGRLRGIAVMTDGVSDDFFPEDQRIAELFSGRAIAGMTRSDGTPVDGVAHTVLAAEQPDAALLDWLRYVRKGSSDDRTLVLFAGEGPV